MGKKKFKEFVQSIQNNVNLAVAISVIKLKPEFLTGQQYAEKIQEMVFENWVKDTKSSFFENKIIEFQRGKLLKELNDLILPASERDACSSALNESLEHIPGVCTGQYLYNEPFIESDSDSSDYDYYKNSVSFIQGMIQLKFAIDSSSSVSTDIVLNILNKTPKLVPDNLHKMISHSEDSGFGEHSTKFVDDSIASSAFRFITHSTKTDYLIKKCLKSVSNFIYKSVQYNSEETYNLWHGSLLEHLSSVFQEISFHPICSEYISKFILRICDNIWSSEETNKHIIWDCQLQILLEFCVNSHICEGVIDSIMSKFKTIVAIMNNLQIGQDEHLNAIHLLEKVPHMTKFVSLIIKKYYSFVNENINKFHNENNRRQCTYNNVMDLWKLNWKENNEKKEAGPIFVDFIQKWQDICENVITASAKNFSFLTICLWDIMALLKSGQNHISK